MPQTVMNDVITMREPSNENSSASDSVNRPRTPVGAEGLGRGRLRGR